MIEKNRWMSIGEIVAPQGLRGDIRIKPSSDFPERFTKPGKPRALIMEKKLGILLTRLFHIPYHTLRPSVSELGAGVVFWPFWPCRPFWLLSIGKQRSLEGI